MVRSETNRKYLTTACELKASVREKASGRMMETEKGLREINSRSETENGLGNVKSTENELGNIKLTV